MFEANGGGLACDRGKILTSTKFPHDLGESQDTLSSVCAPKGCADTQPSVTATMAWRLGSGGLLASLA
jgi:hypothetical protein